MTVAGSIVSLNVTAIGVVVPTPVALSAGSMLATRGAVESGVAVRNVDENAAASGLPARS